MLEALIALVCYCTPLPWMEFDRFCAVPKEAHLGTSVVTSACNPLAYSIDNPT